MKHKKLLTALLALLLVSLALTTVYAIGWYRFDIGGTYSGYPPYAPSDTIHYDDVAGAPCSICYGEICDRILDNEVCRADYDSVKVTYSATLEGVDTWSGTKTLSLADGYHTTTLFQSGDPRCTLQLMHTTYYGMHDHNEFALLNWSESCEIELDITEIKWQEWE